MLFIIVIMMISVIGKFMVSSLATCQWISVGLHITSNFFFFSFSFCILLLYLVVVTMFD